MANKEIYDYLPTVTADYTSTVLSVSCQIDIEESAYKDQVDHEFYGGGITTVNLSENIWFEGYLQWPSGISSSDAGTILDFYADSAKADMKRKSIYWLHPLDGHVYVIKFRGPLSRKWIKEGVLSIPAIPIRIIGKKVDV
ncbi:MAG: hypothetical protein MIO92_15210 [Methanosarcinaceae archaeon]|nr:hypothetical protein [Methanosarcinaceae archaeon]